VPKESPKMVRQFNATGGPCNVRSFRLAGAAYTSLTAFPRMLPLSTPNPLHWCVLAPLASLRRGQSFRR
jgi:hypothetical protein